MLVYMFLDHQQKLLEAEVRELIDWVIPHIFDSAGSRRSVITGRECVQSTDKLPRGSSLVLCGHTKNCFRYG